MQNIMELDVKQFAEEVAKLIKIPKNSQPLILTLRGVEELLGYGKRSSTVAKIIQNPDFPASFTVGDNSIRYWRRKDIEAWVDQQFESQSKMALKINRAA